MKTTYEELDEDEKAIVDMLREFKNRGELTKKHPGVYKRLFDEYSHILDIGLPRTRTVFCHSESKNQFLQKCDKLGYRDTLKGNGVAHFLNKNDPSFDVDFESKFKAFPTKREYLHIRNIERIKKECFNVVGDFIGADKDRQVIRKNIKEFPRYTKRDPDTQTAWKNTLENILKFCEANNRCPKRGPNGINMLSASEEELLASRLSDIKKMKNRLNESNIIIFNKIEFFILKAKKTRYDNVKGTTSKSIKNLDTGDIYKSVKLGAKQIKRSSSSLYEAVKHKTKCEGYHWAYCDENGNILDNSTETE